MKSNENNMDEFRFKGMIEILKKATDPHNASDEVARWMVENLQAHELLMVHLDLKTFFGNDIEAGLFVGMTVASFRRETRGRKVETVTSVGGIMEAEQRLEDIRLRGLERMTVRDWTRLKRMVDLKQGNDETFRKMMESAGVKDEMIDFLDRVYNELQILQDMTRKNWKDEDATT